MTQGARNLTSAATIMAAGAYWFMEALNFRELSRIFPIVVSGAVFLLGGVLAILTLVGRGPAINRATGDAGVRHVRSGTLMGALVVWAALIPPVGLLVASLVGTVLIGVITFGRRRGTVRAVVIAVACVTVFYTVFAFVLNVPFPRAQLG